MLEGGCHLDEDQREQMGREVEDLLPVGEEFKDRRSLVHLLHSPFQLNKATPIKNNRTNLSNYVDVDHINIMHDYKINP